MQADFRDAAGVIWRATLRRAAGRGQLAAGQLVDRYQLQCCPAWDAFVRYLDEPGLWSWPVKSRPCGKPAAKINRGREVAWIGLFR